MLVGEIIVADNIGGHFVFDCRLYSRNDVFIDVEVVLLADCCFTSTETIGLLGTRAQDGHLDFHTAPELCCTVGR